MKQKLSVSFDKETVKKVDEKLVNGIFRNRSHFIEYAVKRFLGEKDGSRE
jgi:Arc/MetJ-type ribon-helix-helix transcriptional regulator